MSKFVYCEECVRYDSCPYKDEVEQGCYDGDFDDKDLLVSELKEIEAYKRGD